MPFDTGAMTFRVYEIDESFREEDSVEGFAAHVVPPIDTLLDEPITGWVGPRHLLDREIVPETVVLGNYLHLYTVKAVRKVPSSLLKAECKMREIAEMKARDVRFLNQKERRAIRKEVQAELLPNMPPTLTGIPVVIRTTDRFCAAQVTSEKRHDAFVASLKEATGGLATQWTPEFAAMRLRGVYAEELMPACFAPESSPDVKTSPGLGTEFFTWLWCQADLHHGIVPGAAQEHGADYALSFEGPLVFFVDGDGARTANLRDGNPLESAEAKTALVSGKKLRSAKINIAQDDRLWTCTVDALDFTFRSLKLPKGNGATPDEIFQDRMEFLQEFLGVFWRLYDTFLTLRANEKKWLKVQKSVQEWVANREAKA